MDDPIERWWATTPEPKLELIDGCLVISTVAGSRRITWELLRDYGPTLALPYAPPALWWDALRQAFKPQPLPETPLAWTAWAQATAYDPEPPPAGPFGSALHSKMLHLLMFALHALEGTGICRSLGRDFVVRLGEQGVTPDLLVIDRNRLAHLQEYYLDGPPSVAIEITLEETAPQDLSVKRELYERGGVPEYWVLEPEVQRASFWLLGADGRYRQVFPDGDQTYYAAAVPQLALSLPKLWTMGDTDWQQPWLPFLPVAQSNPLPPVKRRSPGELGWDARPFAPRVALQSVRIKFEEYISWCPEAKFEAYDGRMVIGSEEGTRRVMGMLLMTFGLAEIVKLAHPKEWVRSLVE